MVNGGRGRDGNRNLFVSGISGQLYRRSGRKLDWALVDEELHRHFNDQERATDTLPWQADVPIAA